MRKLFSKKFQEEKEINARKLYDDDEDEPVDTTKGWTQEIERRKLKWWERLLYQKEVRMVGLWLFCCGFVIGIPLILEYYEIVETVAEEEFGTCRVREGFWIDCLPDKQIHAKNACDTRSCCWVGDDVTNGSCYHRLPSPYSLTVIRSSPGNVAGTLDGTGLLDGLPITIYYRASSNYNGHVLFETGDEDVLQPLQPDATEDEDPIALDIVQKVEEMLVVDIRLKKHPNMDSIARSHFGPVMQSPDLSEISFYLASPNISARNMDSFLWSEETEQEQISYFNYGAESALHLPAVVGRHPSGIWYSLLLETGRPGIQLIQRGREGRPILTWRIMGGGLKVHVLVADTAQQLMTKIRSDFNNDRPPPQLTAAMILQLAGHHMCRRVGQPAAVRRDIVSTTESGVPFDSDCVDERILTTAFDVAEGYDALDLGQLLQDRPLVLPLVLQNKVENQNMPCIRLAMGPAKGRPTEEDEDECDVGKFNGANVTYPDVFDADAFADWMSDGIVSVEERLNLQGKGIAVAGLRLDNIRPTNEATGQQGVCMASQPAYLPRGIQLSGLPCLGSRLPSLDDARLYTVQSLYGSEAVAVASNAKSEAVIYTDVASLKMPELAVFVGSKVDSTWDNMARSLREVLLMGVTGHGLVSMPACGSSTAPITSLHLLCLRWYQLAAYMPGLNSWYLDKDTDRQPYSLPKSYQRYLRWSLEQRYRLYPYLKSLYREWGSTAQPLVRPLFLHYTDLEALPLWRQFLFGQDILVVPVLEATAELVNVTFPPGSWYGLGTGLKVSDQQGSWQAGRVNAALYEIPAFQRGGSAILAYETAEPTLKETNEKAEFSLLVALDCPIKPRNRADNLNKTCLASGTSSTNRESSTISTAAVHSTTAGEGSLSLQLNGTSLEMGSVSGLNSILLSGLVPMGVVLTITLPGGDELLLVIEDGTAGSQPEPNAVYNGDKQVLLLRNLGIKLSDSAQCPEYQCNISWTFK